MKRRTALRSVVWCLCISGAGCLSRITGGCPDPELENELSYEVHESAGLRSHWEGATLLTDAEEIDRFDEEWMSDDDRQWIKETEFSQSVVLGVQVGSSSRSSDIEVLGVERDGDALHAYTCISDPGGTDDWQAYSRLLRVPRGEEPPTAAVLTHWSGGEETTYE